MQWVYQGEEEEEGCSETLKKYITDIEPWEELNSFTVLLQQLVF